MSKSKLRVLVMVNPGASRAETAVTALSSWFSENCDALIVVVNSKKKGERELIAHGKKVDLIVIGGGDGPRRARGRSGEFTQGHWSFHC
jgi:diacylglycerol kinase family enzyme